MSLQIGFKRRNFHNIVTYAARQRHLLVNLTASFDALSQASVFDSHHGSLKRKNWSEFCFEVEQRVELYENTVSCSDDVGAAC